MMKDSLVSILMPCRNAAPFLKECLDSIVNQTEMNWELLVVNDHSTDNSGDILNSYAIQDKRVHVYENDGKGIIDALRMAYSKSNGSMITRMDADDIMALNKLSVLKGQLLAFGKGHISLGLVKYFSAKTLGQGFKRYETWLNGLIREGNCFQEIFKECVIPSPCWMVFKEDLEACEAFVPNRYPEDYDLTFRFYEKRLKCIPCDEVLHYWRDYDARTSRNDENYADNGFLDIKSFYFLKLNYVQEKKLVLWGAGKKGKKIAKELIAQSVNFYWICDNPKKIGKEIYNQELLSVEALEKNDNSQSIITVANQDAQNEIRTYLAAKGLISMKDYFFFC